MTAYYDMMSKHFSFPFLIGKVLTFLPFLEFQVSKKWFPFLIGKVLTIIRGVSYEC